MSGCRALGAGAGGELRVLNLASNGIYSDGIRQLALALGSGSCPQLEDLTLCSNGLGPQGIAELARAVQCGWGACLRTLQLSSNCLGPMGLQALLDTLLLHHRGGRGDGLPALPRLERLNLFLNEIRNDAAVSLARALRHANVLPALRCLNLGANQLGRPAVEQLAQAVATRTAAAAPRTPAAGGGKRGGGGGSLLEVVDLSYNLLPWEKQSALLPLNHTLKL